MVGHLDPFFFKTADEVRKLLGYAFSTGNKFNIADFRHRQLRDGGGRRQLRRARP